MPGDVEAQPRRFIGNLLMVVSGLDWNLGNWLIARLI